MPGSFWASTGIAGFETEDSSVNMKFGNDYDSLVLLVCLEIALLSKRKE